ncbi:S9 family peptidase [Chryseolinea lacunae]|uniref:Prolyl oligopeptidase family serine peptidase n=1 Tax=Chryseolinea lacunae TaxID=2801331 RepID=A0ABS1KKR8_9BACT|nr:S9 family peptidase [Chryseolinea lacunae]MBL0739828.1 prolyl oligopeptidase family serine peptidase [Chryseolinea lacunae]
MKKIFALAAFTLLCLSLNGQGTLQDYRRADSCRTLYKGKVYNAPDKFQWIAGSHTFWYKNNTRTGKEFMLVDAEKNSQRKAFDHARMAQALSAKLRKPMRAQDLPLQDVEFAKDHKSIKFTIDSARISCLLPACQCAVEKVIPESKPESYWGNAFDEGSSHPQKSADSLWLAFVKEHNVFIQSRKTKETFQLSYDGNSGDFYSSYITWSPDSKKLVAYKVTRGQTRVMYMIESSPTDQLQPKLQQREYLKPGDALPHKQPQLFLIDSKKHVPISDELFAQQFSLGDVRWNKDSRFFTFEFNERGHQTYRILKVDATTGGVSIVVDEKSETFIDYSGKRYRHDLSESNQILWASERSGWNHLYLYDVATGKPVNPVTSGEWVVREVVHVDEAKRQVIFAASGLDKDQDPYLVQYCVVNLDGTGFRRLTTSNTNHVASFSDDHLYFVDHASRVDLAPISSVIETATGKTRMEIQKADLTDLLGAGWRMPEVFSAKGRDGKTDIWGIIIRPSKIDENRKYPVIEMIYAGPQSFYVGKSFTERYNSMSALAELGFIVVQLDGMGTSWRSKAFHDVCWKNLKDAGFADRIAWIKAAGEKYRYVDTENMGLFGGSAGGQNAAGGVIFHPEFYKAAVASCGCHDNRMDKMWWNEQWMGYPIGPHYAESSNVVNAPKLGGNLLLIVGELDDNVDPASTYQLANALIKAGKDFELITVPGMGHSGGGEYGERKRRDFFVRTLLHREPPSWKESYPSK